MIRAALFTKVCCWWLLVWMLNGCTALHTSLAKGKLDAQTRMTHTIFLDPVEPEQRSIYLDIRQTMDHPMEGLQQAVHQLLEERGYRLVENPNDAQFWLQVNLRTLRKVHPRELLTHGEFAMTHAEITQLMNPGAKAPYEPRVPNGPPRQASTTTTANNIFYADVIDPDLDISGKDLRRALFAIAIIAGAEYAGQQMVKDVYYTMITDIQVAERLAPDTAPVQEESRQELLQGDNGSTELIWEQATDRRKYQARVISYANKANLKWEQAEASLYEGLVRSLSGIF
jgi:hypothetical protein